MVNDTPEVKIAAETVSFTCADVTIVTTRQSLGMNPSGDGTSSYRWVFNVQQIMMNNNMPFDYTAPGVTTDVYATSDEDRDELGTQLVTALVEIREQMEEDRKSYSDLFKAHLPAPTNPTPTPTA